MAQPVDWVNTQKRGQTFDLHIGEMMEEHIIQIQVHHDSSYWWQSQAKVSVWDERDLSWHLVGTLLPYFVADAYEAADELRARAAALLLGIAR